MLRISKSVSWVLRIPVLSVSCHEAVTLVIKPCALIPDSVHMCCTLVPGMLCHPSHGTDCPKTWEGLGLPLRSYCQYNRISQLQFDKHYLQEHGIEHQTLMPYSPQQNGRAECFQQIIISKAESMRHAAGLSDGFWKHAVGTAVHVYNVTPISKAEFLTPKEMWSGSKPDISHLRIFGCAAYVHILKGKDKSSIRRVEK